MCDVLANLVSYTCWAFGAHDQASPACSPLFLGYASKVRKVSTIKDDSSCCCIDLDPWLCRRASAHGFESLSQAKSGQREKAACGIRQPRNPSNLLPFEKTKTKKKKDKKKTDLRSWPPGPPFPSCSPTRPSTALSLHRVIHIQHKRRIHFSIWCIASSQGKPEAKALDCDCSKSLSCPIRVGVAIERLNVSARKYCHTPFFFFFFF